MTDDDYLSISDTADILGISRRTAYRRVASGDLRVRLLGTGGGRLFVAREEIDRYLGDRTAAETDEFRQVAA